MNRTQFLSTTLLSLFSLGASLHALDVSPISIQVDQASDDKHGRYDETQKKSLHVTLTNSSAQDLSVKMKYYIFAKDIKGKDVVVLKDGEQDTTVKAHATETVNTPEITAKSNEKHLQGAALASRGHAAKTGKEVEAGGQKIVGYGVQIIQGGKVITDYFSEPSLKANVGGGQ